MNDISEVLKRLQNMLPKGVTPKFTSAGELIAWHREEERKYSDRLQREKHRIRAENVFARSGIYDRYQQCSFENYLVDHPGQQHALCLAKLWLANFDYSGACFVFSGSVGTGKNHLASAIGNMLLKKGKTVLIITVADLMVDVGVSYYAEKNEKTLLNELCHLDLLVLDDVGVQRNTAHEFVILSQIIDRRTAMHKLVGILTNLNEKDLSGILRPRVMDRLMMDGGLWVNFNWKSYRSQFNRQHK